MMRVTSDAFPLSPLHKTRGTRDREARGVPGLPRLGLEPGGAFCSSGRGDLARGGQVRRALVGLYATQRHLRYRLAIGTFDPVLIP